jgi:hypothetical protein
MNNINDTNKFDDKLTDIQIGYRDFILSFNISWNIFCTLTYPFRASSKRVIREVNLIQRFLGKRFKTQILYIGIFAETHAHILFHSKKPLFIEDLFFLSVKYENFYFKNIFPFKFNYDLKLIEEENIDKIAQYLIRKAHMVDNSFSLITSSPKKLNKYKKK